MAKIYHASLQGLYLKKDGFLSVSDLNQTEWAEVDIESSDFYLLVPKDSALSSEYTKGWRISDLSPINSTGIKTHRDHFVIDFDREVLVERLHEFRNTSISDQTISDRYQIQDTRDWKISQRRSSFANLDNWKKHITSCLYRPFDWRSYCHHEDVVELPRDEVMKHMRSGQNLALSTTRSTEISRGWEHIFCTEGLIQHHTVSIKETNYLFPLYLYPETQMEQEMGMTRCPNLSETFLKDITNRLGYTPTPEAIFYYIYAIFHSPTYRTRYAEFLKIDFPRVPLTSNDHLFRQLATYGEELVALHLMKSSKLKKPITRFVESGGDRTVAPAHPKYELATQNVVINKKGDKFTGVPEEVWNFYVGGYPVCAKWLKDRKGRTLSDGDIQHYQQIVVALQETIKLMKAIDQAIPRFPIE
jgi:predicted helicase